MRPIGANLGDVLDRLGSKAQVAEPKPPKCPLCRDRGLIVIPSPTSNGVAVYCECRRRTPDDEGVRLALSAAGMGDRDIRSALGEWDANYQGVPTPWPVVVDQWWEVLKKPARKGTPCVLYGPAGTGKSKVGAMIAARFIRERRPGGVLWRYGGRMAERLFYRPADEKQEGPPPASVERAALKSAGLLVIDDILEATRNPVGWDLIVAEIDARYCNDLPIFVTGNAATGEAWSLPDVKTTSRLASGAVIPMDAAVDLRQARRKKK
jgi:hypothetical protein